jgi:hypothetical protein
MKKITVIFSLMAHHGEWLAGAFAVETTGRRPYSIAHGWMNLTDTTMNS